MGYVKPGTYRARGNGEHAEMNESSKKGTPQVEVPFELLDTGDVLTWVAFLTPSALPYTVKGLRAAGWQGDDLSDLSTVGSKECEIVVADEEWEGKVRSRIQFVNDFGGPRVGKPMSEQDKKAFAQRLRGAVVAANGGKPSVKAPPPQRPSTPPPSSPPASGGQQSDDDIPF